jgi:hypothetical protein
MGGTPDERPTRESVPQQQSQIPAEPQRAVAQDVRLQSVLESRGSSRDLCEPAANPGTRGDNTGVGRVNSLPSEDTLHLARQRCSSYDASLRTLERPTGQRGANLFRHSTSNVPNLSLPEIKAAMSDLVKPLQVVTKEKSLIRYA